MSSQEGHGQIGKAPVTLRHRKGSWSFKGDILDVYFYERIFNLPKKNEHTIKRSALQVEAIQSIVFVYFEL